MELCQSCFRPRHAHVFDRCPKLGLHVVLDAESVQRARETGHPKLLAKVLVGGQRGAMEGVEIGALRVVECAEG